MLVVGVGAISACSSPTVVGMNRHARSSSSFTNNLCSRRNSSSQQHSTTSSISLSIINNNNNNNNIKSSSSAVEPEPSLANRLRLGGLSEDRLSYKEKFLVRCYEVGVNKTSTVETIANFLQEVSANHGQSAGLSTDGLSTTPAMRKLRLIWVTTRMHIEIYKYPAWSDVIEIETWAQTGSKFTARRDWFLKDFATGEVIGRCTSTWVMMNQDTRRLQKMTDDVHDEYHKYCTKRAVFPEENNASSRKIPKLDEPSQYCKLGLVPRRADLDMNMHVNNVTYIAWVMESMPQETIDSHELHSITLDFKRESQHEDVIDSFTSSESVMDDTVLVANGTCNGSPAADKGENDYLEFLHLLRFSKDGSEINRGRTVWRKK